MSRKPHGNLDRFWESYLEIERQFLEFTRFVPLLRRHSEIVSPKLADIATLAGNWIDTIFNRMRESGWPFKEPPCSLPTEEIENITQFRRTFEAPYQLSKQEVTVKRYFTEFFKVLRPFESFHERKNPEWFRDYSRLKHNRLALQEAMTLVKTTDALAGLFLLNVYPHEMREYLLELDVIHSLGFQFHYKGEGIKRVLLSHPSVLFDEFGGPERIGPIVAETRLFKFAFATRATFTMDDLTKT